MRKLENKVAIVTGAGSGMGKAIAIRFAKEGAKIIAADINSERLESLQEEIDNFGGTASTIITNVAKEDDINAMVELAIASYGTLDILVNNAGIMDSFEPVSEVSNALYERVMKINVEGPLKAMRKAMSVFLPKNEGNIINICSIGGLNAGRAGAAYTASKFALVGLTRNTGYLYSKSGIRCNGIAPGDISTNINDNIDLGKITAMTQDRILAGVPLSPHSADPDVIAKAALFLASDDSTFVNGEILVVDGGWSAY
ncbi:glucose 1-dehydrogenase [Sphingobacterium sp.]|uniref:glucose 1-dehydrogenase n=1 Tax=Sphingobacterium sp. TaxID=341027 RepID=UPI002584E730|nr:glucose 1-dehydrogenase [Sphingobacterium sp.]WET68607.1 MAG: glucose 1-dehydrogenase [Sphingobacterium sp.]